MKKVLIFSMCLLITFSLFTACGKNSNGDHLETTISQQQEETSLSTTALQIQSSTVKTSTETSKETSTEAKVTSTSVSEQSEIAQTTQVSPTEENLDMIQKNSIAWLNYLAMLTQEINDSKNGKMYLEEAYAVLINNTNPENVDEITERYLVSLLDLIEKYRIIDEKRERLQYIYEQNQAKALKEAMPDPVAFLGAVVSLNIEQIAASVVYMAVDSYSSYVAYNNEINQEYLKDGWELDDKASENLHDSRKRAFTYMIEIVRDYNLPGNLALNEKQIEKFVECENSENTDQQLQFLESNKETYQAFGGYWILLSECYYNNGQYQKCLDSISEYERLNTGIFRKDYNLAKVLPLAIVSASKTQSQSSYTKTAEKYLNMIIQNTDEEEWSLRYFAATTYVDLYTETHNGEYLKQAYDILLNNITNLTTKQNEMNKAYLADVKEISVPDDATKEEQKNIKAYNKEQKKKRKTELPETYEPLALNCDLFFSIAKQLQLSQSEKDRVNGILYGNDCPAFLTEPLQNLFSFQKNDIEAHATYDKNKFIVPVSYVSKDAIIRVTVSDGNQSIVYDDWKIDTVERPKKGKDNIEAFEAVYTSKKAKNCEWSKNSIVTVEISNGEYTNSDPLVIQFEVCKFKDRKIFSDTVEFKQID